MPAVKPIRHHSVPVPTSAQLAWQEAGFGVFFHFGINTFHGVEWSDGTLPAASFHPRAFDPAQWIDAARRAGAGYVVLTAKHHDGFCLWPTDTTDYSVMSSPFRRDAVGEVARACEQAGMPLGLYVSPWDRNAKCYPNAEAYDRFYVAQLTELCTRYGELFEIWFDGAGSEGRTYAWDDIMAVVDKHQPNAMVFNMGRPTIRWAGNEDGLAADPCRYSVGKTDVSMFTSDVQMLTTAHYLPPECDVPIRANWFWHPDDEHTLKSREQLLDIWDNSVGLGAGLLLNLAPNRDGRLDDADCARLLEVTGEIERRFAEPVTAMLQPQGDYVTAEFPRPVTFERLELCEDLIHGQLIERHEVIAGDAVVASGQTVGIRRWHQIAPVTGDRLTIRVAGGQGARLRTVKAFEEQVADKSR